MPKLYWLMHDGFGMVVWHIEDTGESTAEIWKYWEELIEGEEYDPGVETISKQYLTTDELADYL